LGSKQKREEKGEKRKGHYSISVSSGIVCDARLRWKEEGGRNEGETARNIAREMKNRRGRNAGEKKQQRVRKEQAITLIAERMSPIRKISS
jgi:hypothetical protein